MFSNNRIVTLLPQQKLTKMENQQKNSQAKDIISVLNKKLKTSEQTSTGFITALNEFQNSIGDSVKYNPRNGSYMVENYYIVPGYLKPDAPFLKNINFLNSYGFCHTSAPKLITIHHEKNSNFGVIIYKINETSGGILTPYIDIADKIPAEKKQQFLNEQAYLLKSASLYNPAILEDYSAWGVTPDTKNIFIDSWASLKECKKPEQKGLIIEEYKKLLK